MKLSKSLAVIFIAGGLSTTAQASTTGVESLLTRLVSTAITMTVEEVNNEVKETVVNTAYQFDNAVTNARIEVKELPAASEDEE